MFVEHYERTFIKLNDVNMDYLMNKINQYVGTQLRLPFLNFLKTYES